MMYGLDLLGLPKYIVHAVRVFPVGWALGCFSDTFGDARGGVERIIKTGRCPRVRVHLAWKDNHNFSQKDFKQIEKEAKKWVPLVQRYPHIEWGFSGACEHHLSIADSVRLAELVLNVHPDQIAVNTGDHDIAIAQTISETHGTKARVGKPKYNFSFDGSACVDSDAESLKQKHKSAETYFFWEPRFNGRWETKDTTPRPQRTGWPDIKLLRSVVCLGGECGAVSLPNKWLYKSHAENHGTGDARAEKALFIAPIKTDAILLKDKKTVKAVFKYFGPYQGGGHRYYSTKWGYEIAEKPLTVEANSKAIGQVNPVFRCGVFR